MNPQENESQPVKGSKEKSRKPYLLSREKVLGFNFGNYAVAATICSVAFCYLLVQCKGSDGVFNHEAADRYFNSWANNLYGFSILFLGMDLSPRISSKLFGKFRGEKNDQTTV